MDPGGKENKKYYLKKIIKFEILPWSVSHFDSQSWTFQQDGAPSHTANVLQPWCKDHFSRNIERAERQASSPNLNPLDYAIWGYFESKVYATHHQSLEALQVPLIKEWSKVGVKCERAVRGAFPKRLKHVIKRRGERIE